MRTQIDVFELMSFHKNGNKIFREHYDMLKSHGSTEINPDG